MASTRIRQRTDNVDRLIAIEGCDLDRNHVFNFEETAPEFVRQNPASNRRLQVKADNRNRRCNRASMRNQFSNAFVLEISKAQ